MVLDVKRNAVSTRCACFHLRLVSIAREDSERFEDHGGSHSMFSRISGQPEQGVALLLACGFDMLGEPSATWHPVVWFGKLIQRLERAAPQGRVTRLSYVTAILILATPCALLPSELIHHLAVYTHKEALRRGSTNTGLNTSTLHK